MKLSEKGKDFEGNNLTEDSVKGGVQIIYKGEEYITGNRRNNLVELFWGQKFKIAVFIKNIQLIDYRN